MEKKICLWMTPERYLFSILSLRVDMKEGILGEKEYDSWIVKTFLTMKKLEHSFLRLILKSKYVFAIIL